MHLSIYPHPPSPCCFFWGGQTPRAGHFRHQQKTKKSWTPPQDPAPAARVVAQHNDRLSTMTSEKNPPTPPKWTTSKIDGTCNDDKGKQVHSNVRRAASRRRDPPPWWLGGELVNRSNARADEPKPKQNPHAWYEPKQVGWLQPDLYEWKMGWQSPISSIWKYSCLGFQDYVTKHLFVVGLP